MKLKQLNNPKLVFFGSSKYSTIVEEAVNKKYPISLVVTVPDRKSGSQILISPVKKFAENNKIPVLTTDKLSDKEIETIAKYKPDFLVVCDYGLLIPKKLLDLPKKAAVNVHHSLLPKYRGPSPAPSAILAGEKITGVTIMEMGVDLDTGDILTQKEYVIKPSETTDSLLTTLNILGASLLVQVLEDFDEYHKNRKKQDDKQATFTPHMKKSDGYITLSVIPSERKRIEESHSRNNPVERDPSTTLGMTKEKLDRMIRAYFPWPGVWFNYKINGKELRIKLLPLLGHPERSEGSHSINVIPAKAGIYIDGSPIKSGMTGKRDSSAMPQNDIKNRILLQVEGKNPMSIRDFKNGYKEGKEILQKLNLEIRDKR